MHSKYSRISVSLAILAILLLITAAGCGSKKDNKGTTSPTTASTQTPVITESATSGSQVQPGALDGNALVNDRCLGCHSRARIDNAQKDRAGWESTVDQMISKGAELNAEERQAVIDYLSGQ